MRGFQQLTAVGHVGQDPEVKYSASGDAVVQFSVACSESWKDRNGEKKERTEWLRCTAFGKLAEIIGQYVKKGDPLFIQGSLRTEEWQDRDGNKKSTVKVIVDEIRLLGGGQKDQQGQPQQQAPRQQNHGSQRRDAPPDDGPGEEPPF